ncbi:hypothetical protein BCR44DRAFT_36763, partial [Catenaria anguillulae PL171]
MEQASVSIPGPLLSLLAHKAFSGPGPHALGLLLGHIHLSTELAVHDHSTEQHATQHIRFVVTDLLDFSATPTPTHRNLTWFDPLGTIDFALVNKHLAKAQQIVGLYSLRPGSPTPSMRETRLWTQLIERGCAALPANVSTAGCVFFLGQHATEPLAATAASLSSPSPLVPSHGGAGDATTAASNVPTVATWRQTCFHRYSSAAGDDTSAFRIPIEIPNLLQSMGVGRHPPLVHAHSAELGSVFDVEAGVKRARDVCERGLNRLDHLVNS